MQSEALTVRREVYIPAVRFEGMDEARLFYYTGHDSLELAEERNISAYSDVPGRSWRRVSPDNGRTWGEWEDLTGTLYTHFGDDEMFSWRYQKPVWNPVHRHYVGIDVNRLCIGGAIAAENRYWQGDFFPEHTYMTITDEDGNKTVQMIRYEDGPAYVPGGKEQEYAIENDCSCTYYTVLHNGDILLPLSLKLRQCCKLTGEDYHAWCPEINGNHSGLLVARGVFNRETGHYDFTFSRPVMLSTIFNSRGILETTVAELENGRIVIVFRGSNGVFGGWHSVIEPHMPPVKWYTFSDDGGKTFTSPMPWHFDTREFIYSSSTLSSFIRSEKNGRLYWLGNITGPDAEYNYPRYPLYLCEVDERYGVPIKDTLTVVDTRREGESDRLQLSNFGIYQDRETGDIVLTRMKYDCYKGVENAPEQITAVGEKTVHGGVWRYTVTVPDGARAYHA